ncbi:MAG: ferric reductase-like transmembrane domain-containing protein, partial [Planctomycetales bacterium]|nr:ferric reductase-like transmembrane domain-containing protein [Planctomycetales bacterium]
LLLSLVITPLRMLTGWSSVIAYRRPLGLFGFMYAVVHLGIYFGLDRALDVSSTIEELLSRRFLQVGGISLLLMIPLAITSTNAMMQRIGARRWKQLHRLAYIAAILGVLHYYMLVKSDVRQPLAFAAVLTPLLGLRLLSFKRSALRSSNSTNASSRGAATAMKKPKIWKGKLQIAKIIHETHNVKTFRFRLPDNGDLPFRHQPGQFLNVQLPIDGAIVRRCYTISSSPTARNYCEITVKREEHGVASKFLHDHMREGSTLEISAPAGRFVFDESKHSAVTLIAGGVGITPMISIARSLTERAWSGEIYFIFSARTDKDIIFHDELMKMAERFPNFRLFVTLTDLEPGHSWTGTTGRVNASVLRAFVPSVAKQPAFVCGPKPMMDATCDMLRDTGVPTEWIFTEAFLSPGKDGSNAVDEANEAETDPPIQSTILFEKSQVATDCESDTTVLEAAESVGVMIEFECRAGICGQCKVKCLAGKVHMASHDALSMVEKSQGLILACQAVPRSSELRIDA